MSKKPPKISDYWTITRAARKCEVNRTTLLYAVEQENCASAKLASGEYVVTLEAVRAWLATERRPGRKSSNGRTT